jgi:hypothetical protein
VQQWFDGQNRSWVKTAPEPLSAGFDGPQSIPQSLAHSYLKAFIFSSSTDLPPFNFK